MNTGAGASRTPRRRPGGRLFLAGLAAIVAVFFLAARFLPPIDTQATSVAPTVGYTNQLLPLLAILLAGATLLGALVVRYGPPSEPSPIADRTEAAYWHWHVLAAAVLCVAVVTLVPTWSRPNNYFGARVVMMDAGERPYVDFEYAYGALIAYLPYALHAAGLSVQGALEITLSLCVVAGVMSLGVVTQRWLSGPGIRLLLFWALTACEAFVDPGPSLNYNFGRYALPFALLIVLARAERRLGALGLFAATAGANALVYLISPEVGCAFTFGVLAWLGAAARLVPWPKILSSLAALIVSIGGLLVFAGPMFSTLEAYGQSQVLMPVVPNPIMTLFVVAFLCVGACAAAMTWALWRGSPTTGTARRDAELVGCIAIGAALLPAAIGRSWPTITIAYGFAPIVILIGQLITWRATKTTIVVTSLFGTLVAFSAWPGIRTDVGELRRPCRAMDCVRAPLTAPQVLLGRFRGAYDPLALIGRTVPPITDVGFYPGLRMGDVTTQKAVARKTDELRRATFYVIPAQRERATAAAGAPINRALRDFGRIGLYPFRLAAADQARRIDAPFVDLLYAGCQPLASANGIQVCVLRKDLPAPH